jgi:hypothetical protein
MPNIPFIYNFILMISGKAKLFQKLGLGMFSSSKVKVDNGSPPVMAPFNPV